MLNDDIQYGRPPYPQTQAIGKAAPSLRETGEKYAQQMSGMAGMGYAASPPPQKESICDLLGFRCAELLKLITILESKLFGPTLDANPQHPSGFAVSPGIMNLVEAAAVAVGMANNRIDTIISELGGR